MRIPEEFIRDLAARADLAAIVGARVQLRRSGKRLFGLCPFHPEKTPSFHVSPEKGMFHCFGCGAHGDAIGFFMQKENLDFIAAVEALARECGVEVPRESSPRELASAPLTAVLRAATAHFMGELAKSEKTLEYVRQRGIGEETASAFRLGFAPPGWERIVKKLGREHSPKILVEAGLARASEEGRVYDYFRDRLMFPILSPRREPLGFGGRALGDDAAKYLNSPETPLFHKSRVLFGLPQAIEAVRQTRRVIVVEGYMDVVGLFENGIRNGVATMGTAATEAQAAVLTRLADEIVFAFDGDDAGRRAARKALENFLPALRDGKSVSFMTLPKGEDPDSVARAQGGDGFLRLLKNAVGLGDFWVDSLWGEFESLPTAEARKSAFCGAAARCCAPCARRRICAKRCSRVWRKKRRFRRRESKRRCATRVISPRPPSPPPNPPRATISKTFAREFRRAVNFFGFCFFCGIAPICCLESPPRRCRPKIRRARRRRRRFWWRKCGWPIRPIWRRFCAPIASMRSPPISPPPSPRPTPKPNSTVCSPPSPRAAKTRSASAKRTTPNRSQRGFGRYNRGFAKLHR